MPNCFEILARDKNSAARAGIIKTLYGEIPTPCFMPIATAGAVHHLTSQELREAGTTMILANTYHLSLRPGTPYLAARGGLHKFMGWDGPILTDSGGFQVFSLGARAQARGSNGFVRLSPDGATFRSHLDGSEHFLTPELVIDHQLNIGSDIAMVLDVCPPQPCSREILSEAVSMTTNWARRSLAHAATKGIREKMLIFGIIQGGADEELRKEGAAAITALPFDGFAIGGVAVGESKEEMERAVEIAAPLLPADKSRYLMGVGMPDEIVHAVKQGIDLFDCVLPTRDARHGRAYRKISNFKFQISNCDPWYETINVGNEQWKSANEPIDPNCVCPTCRNHTLAYLRHLTVIGEPLGQRLLTLHNLAFYLEFLRSLRDEIIGGEG